MTKEQINDESMKHSTNWLEAGSGSLGRLYFELIGCDNLPNMDSTTLNPLDKTDSFACKSTAVVDTYLVDTHYRTLTCSFAVHPRRHGL
jgi:hypothetical protein